MCKAISNGIMVVGNKLVLGSRTIGYTLYDVDLGEQILASEKDIRDMLTEGKTVHGFRISEDGKTAELLDEVNIPKVAGLSTSPLKPITGMVTEIHTLTEKTDTGEYVLINSRFGRKAIPENQVRSLIELGAVINGIKLDGKNIKTWFDSVEQTEPEKEKKDTK